MSFSVPCLSPGTALQAGVMVVAEWVGHGLDPEQLQFVEVGRAGGARDPRRAEW